LYITYRPPQHLFSTFTPRLYTFGFQWYDCFVNTY
jgi:hypothetical protein